MQPNWYASGRHAGINIASFCDNSPEIIHLHHALQNRHDCADLNSYFAEGSTINGGVETALPDGSLASSLDGTLAETSATEVTAKKSKRKNAEFNDKVINIMQNDSAVGKGILEEMKKSRNSTDLSNLRREIMQYRIHFPSTFAEDPIYVDMMNAYSEKMKLYTD